jgi:hypothetical protein
LPKTYLKNESSPYLVLSTDHSLPLYSLVLLPWVCGRAISS